MMRSQPTDRPAYDTTGVFVIDGLEPGTYTIVATAKGHAPARKSQVRVLSGQATDGGTLTLGQGVSLHGRVVAAKDESPVPGATVSATTPRSFAFPRGGTEAGIAAVAGLDGTFVLEGLEPGAVTLYAQHPDYSPAEVRVNLQESMEGEDVVVQLGQGGILTGTVRDSDGLPVVGAQIMLAKGMFRGQMTTASTEADGRYVVERLTPGNYVAARAPEGSSLAGLDMKSVTIEEGETTVLDFGEMARITLTGRVLRGRHPAGEARLIFLASTGGSMVAGNLKMAEADAEGRYRVGLEQPGTYQVVVSTGGIGLMRGHTVEVVVPDEATVYRDIVLETTGIFGTVTDSGGEPVPGATVLASAEASGSSSFAAQTTTWTDSAGSYTLEGLEPGIYRVSVRAGGFPATERYPVTVSEEQDQPVDFQLEEGLVLRGRVVDPSGQGLAGAMVFAAPTGGRDTVPSYTLTDINGAFELAAPVEGVMDLTAVAGGWAPARVTGVAASSDPDAVETILRVSPGGRIRISVVGPEGRPVAGVQISLEPVESWPAQVTAFNMQRPLPTNAQGNTLVSHLAPGAYVVSAVGRPDIRPVEVDVQEGQEAVAGLSLVQP
jgi:protocatechuate 3,4-dioxygenase beta subunit